MNLGNVFMQRFIRLSGWLIALMVLQACGGGSSGSKDKYSISVNHSAVSFQNAVFDVNQQQVTLEITYKGDGLLLGFAPDTQIASWLNYDIETVSPEKSVIHLSVENAAGDGFLPAGDYQTTLRLSTGDLVNTDLVHKDIDVSLYIWLLLTSDDELAFSETFGASEVPSQTFSITSDEATPASWQISSDVDWLSFSESEGTGNADIVVDADLSGFNQAGLNTGTIFITEAKTGETTEIAVDLGLDSLRLFADDKTLAFSQLGNTSKLNQQVSISTNAYTAIGWQAQTDLPWLMLSSDAETNSLTVAVDAQADLEDGYYQGEISVSPVDPESAISEVIKVSLYKSADDANNERISEYLPTPGTQVTDPLRPYLYSATDNKVVVHHVYSGKLIGEYPLTIEETIIDEDGNQITELVERDFPLSNFVIHPDASLLLARATESVTDETDPDNPVTTETVHEISVNLEDFSFSLLPDADIQTAPAHITRIDGLYFVVTNAVEFTDLNLIVQGFATDNIYFARSFASAWGANSLFTLDNGGTTIRRYTGQANEFLSDTLNVTMTHEYVSETTTERTIPPENEEDEPTIIPPANIFELVVSSDEQNLYTVSEQLEWISFDGETFSDQGLLNNNENSQTLDVAISDINRPYFLTLDVTSGFYLTIYDNNQQQVSDNLLPVTSASSLLLGHDDNRLILQNSGAALAELISVEQFNLSAQSLNFTAVYGDSDIAEQTLAVTGLGDNWQIRSDADWLTVSPTSGNGDASLTLTVDTTGLVPGIYSAQLTIYDPASGQSQTIVVEFAMDEARLYANDAAVALVKSNDIESLSQTITVLTNSQNQGQWQASTDVDWLSLSQSGNRLTISADPASLADDFYQASITLSTADGSLVTTGNIAVGLTVISEDSITRDLPGISPNTGAMVTDPLRPYTYVGQGAQLLVIDNYSGEIIDTLEPPKADLILDNFVILEDGSTLYVRQRELDSDNQLQTYYYRVDLTSREFAELDDALIDIFYQPSYATRIDGIDILVTAGLEYADTNLTTLYRDSSLSEFPQAIASPANKSELFIKSGDTITQYSARYNALSTEVLTVNETGSSQFDSYNTVSDLALTSTGQHLYTSGTDTEWSSFNGENYTDNGILHDGSFTSVLTQHILPNDNVYFYRFDGNALYLTLYDNNQQEVSSQNVGSISTQQTYFSGDNKRIILRGSLLGIPTLQINTID